MHTQTHTETDTHRHRHRHTQTCTHTHTHTRTHTQGHTGSNQADPSSTPLVQTEGVHREKGLLRRCSAPPARSPRWPCRGLSIPPLQKLCCIPSLLLGSCAPSPPSPALNGTRDEPVSSAEGTEFRETGQSTAALGRDTDGRPPCPTKRKVLSSSSSRAPLRVAGFQGTKKALSSEARGANT